MDFFASLSVPNKLFSIWDSEWKGVVYCHTSSRLRIWSLEHNKKKGRVLLGPAAA